MQFIKALENTAKGALVGVAAVVALPIFGPVGTVTALGMAVAASVGALAGLADAVNGD